MTFSSRVCLNAHTSGCIKQTEVKVKKHKDKREQGKERSFSNKKQKVTTANSSRFS